MKILYDCTVLDKWKGHATGIQRVVKELGKELSLSMPGIILVKFETNGDCFQYNLEENKIEVKIFIESGDLIFCANHDWDYIDHFIILQKYFSSGVLFGVLLYDIIPLKFPFTYSKFFVSRFEFWLRKTLETANFVFAISKNTIEDVMKYAKENNLPKHNIQLLRIGDHLPLAGEVEGVSKIINKKLDTPYILSVGTIEFRKNHVVLLNAYRYLLEDIGFTPPKLYIIGKQGSFDGGIKCQAQGDVRLRGLVEVIHGVTDGELMEFYSSAMFTVYPSLYEGWGLPVGESLYYGKPCVTSKSSSMIEIAPYFTRFAHPIKVEEWANHIKELSENPIMLNAESLIIKEKYVRVTWKDTAFELKRKIYDKFSISTNLL